MTVITPTDRPKSVCSRCVIEVLVAFLCVVTLLFGFSVGVGAFVIGLSQISTFFSFLIENVHSQMFCKRNVVIYKHIV